MLLFLIPKLSAVSRPEQKIKRLHAPTGVNCFISSSLNLDQILENAARKAPELEYTGSESPGRHRKREVIFTFSQAGPASAREILAVESGVEVSKEFS